MDPVNIEVMPAGQHRGVVTKSHDKPREKEGAAGSRNMNRWIAGALIGGGTALVSGVAAVSAATMLRYHKHVYMQDAERLVAQGDPENSIFVGLGQRRTAAVQIPGVDPLLSRAQEQTRRNGENEQELNLCESGLELDFDFCNNILRFSSERLNRFFMSYIDACLFERLSMFRVALPSGDVDCFDATIWGTGLLWCSWNAAGLLHRHFQTPSWTRENSQLRFESFVLGAWTGAVCLLFVPRMLAKP